MPRFRPALADPLKGVPPSPEAIRPLIADLLAPRHFYLGPGLQLEWHHLPAEESAWEIFQGRLLDPAHTREKAIFEAWNVHQIQDGTRSAEPLLSLKLDALSGQLHVVRGLECYVWEGYDSGGNVYLSRERRKWVRELVSTVHLESFRDLEELRDELNCCLFHAVVGTSRLPLSSVEAPLPAFAFGELFYCYHPRPNPGEPRRGYAALLDMLCAELNRREQARWLETVLHALPLADLDATAESFIRHWTALGLGSTDLIRCLQTLFNEVSLSPYTDLVERLLAFLEVLHRADFLKAEQVLDFFRSLLIQIGRHLTAYDLVTFHHRGANYPDALLLDVVLKSYLGLGESQPLLLLDAASDNAVTLREKRLRRRALRQGYLLRRLYEGLAVPDLPTSPGENNRVLPPSHPRVPEEQLLQCTRRRRRLYHGDPLPDSLGPAMTEGLRQSIRDLEHTEELRELGLALYVDRPLGDQRAAEPDRTLLLSSLAFSRSLAGQRLHALKREPRLQPESALLDACLARLPNLSQGLPLDQIGTTRRPAAVSLTDARRAAADFVFLRTTAATLADLLGQFDFQPLIERFGLDFLTRRALVARSPSSENLLIYDDRYRPRLEFQVDTEFGYAVRANQEYPAGGLLVLRVWEEPATGEALTLHDLRQQPWRLD